MKVGKDFLVRSCLLITLIKCLKGYKFLGSLCSIVKNLIVRGAQGTSLISRQEVSNILLPKTSVCPVVEKVKYDKIEAFTFKWRRRFLLQLQLLQI